MRLLQTCYLTLLFSASSTLVFAKIDQLSQSRAQAVKDAFRHAWNGYKQYAFGHDELRPLTNGSSDTRNGWGASIFDALDTMIIMGLDDEYRLALEHVRNVNWNSTKEPSKTFETNIRYLGGLLAAYDLRPDPTLLEKALELTEQVILPAYRTPNGIPAAYVDVSKGEPILGDDLILAEFGSLQLELVRLSQITGDNKYASIANYVIHRMRDVPSNFPGLYPISWSLKNFRPSSGYITISGGGDSYYEYLLKTHLLMGGQEAVQLDMWKQSIKSMQKFLRSETDRNLVFLGELNDEYKLLQTGELVCFLPGNILMGARFLKNREMEKFATELMKGCSEAWDLTPTGIAPETWSWIDKGQNMSGYPMALQLAMKNTGFIAQDLSYDLRPETLESLFYFYRLTGNKDYQEMAWKMFEAIEKYCKTPTGYTRIGDISNINDIHPQDFEESYFFAETMKYLYLIFSDPKLISLDDYVFNTEAHPFKLSRPVKLQARFRD